MQTIKRIILNSFLMAGMTTMQAGAAIVTDGLVANYSVDTLAGTANGAAVTVWTNSLGAWGTGNGDAVSVGSAGAPTFKTGATPLGKASIDFGSDVRAFQVTVNGTAGGTYNAYAGMTMIAVVKVNGTSFYGALMGPLENNSLRMVSTSDAIQLLLNNAWVTANSGPVVGNWMILAADLSNNTSGTDTKGNMYMRKLNDTLTSSWSFTGTAGDAEFNLEAGSNNDRFGIGAGLNWYGGAHLAFNGEMSQVLVYNRILSPSERQQTIDALHADFLKEAAPIAEYTLNKTNGIAPLTVAFDGSASHVSGGTITSYAWDFGDGLTGSGATVRHTFYRPGAYSVGLTVTDNNNKSNTFHGSFISLPPVTNGLALWLDAGNADGKASSTLTNNAMVSAWTDLSRSGNDHASPDPVFYPQFKSGVMGPQNRPVLDFNNADGRWDRMVKAGMSYAGFSGLSVFIVSDKRNTSGSWDFLVGTGSGYDGNDWSIRQNGGTVDSSQFILAAATGFAATFGSGFPLNEYLILSATYPYGTATTLTYRRTDTNRVVTTQAATGTYSETGSRNSGVGGRYAEGYSSDARIAEVLIYGRALSSNEVADVETYLWNKYYIPWTSPYPPPPGTVIMVR